MTGFAAYFHIQASIGMMMGGLLPPITAVLSIIFLKKSVLRHEYLAMGIIMIGCIFIGSVALENEEK
jgi:drug/metabolite transporter (DMT)-like permease